MEKIWQIAEKKSDDPIKQILFNRGISDREQQKFLDPSFETDFFDPELLPDFKIAIDRISKAIVAKEKIGIFADYDADGIPGAALLFRALRRLNVELEVYIPTRTEGYGFSHKGIDHLISSGCSLIISVDLGIRETDKAKYIKTRKIDLIITDHHEPGEKLPESLAIVNPKRKDSKYPFKEICGAGVIYKIIQGLSKLYPNVINEKFLKWNLDLVAVSTISDVVPLISENRIIAKFGLVVLSKTKNLGLQELYKVSAIDPGKIDAYAVGFQIGPRINAPGRLNDAAASFELLITEDENEAEKAANQLNQQNLLRQESMNNVFEEANRIIERDRLFEHKIIILKKTGWQKGVIGPVASQLVERYLRPVILFAQSNEILDGSCRSISSYDITDALSRRQNLLLGFGGHKMAAGVHMEVKNFDRFAGQMTNDAGEKISDTDTLPKIKIDLELNKNKLSISLIKKLEALGPYGLGNPKPVFVSRKAKLISHRLVGRDEKHLQLRFRFGLQEIKGIIFNHEVEIDNLKSSQDYDIVYQPGLNFWNGKNWIDLRILDLRISDEK